MKKNGFTLIELIFTIIIISMLAAITTPNIINMLEKNKVNNYNGVIDNILKATELYVTDNKYNLNFNQNCSSDISEITTSITLNDLVNSKYLSSPVKNECTKEEFNNLSSILVTIKLNCETKQFSYVLPFEKIESCN